MTLSPRLGVRPPGGLACTLKCRPSPGAGQETLEEVLAAILAGQVGPPPAEARLFAALASPGNRELRHQDLIQLGPRDGGTFHKDKSLLGLRHGCTASCSPRAHFVIGRNCLRL